MGGDIETPALAALAGVIVLIVGHIVWKWYNRAKFKDRQRSYWNEWSERHKN